MSGFVSSGHKHRSARSSDDGSSGGHRTSYSSVARSWRLLKHADMFRSLRDADGVGFPQRERIYRWAGPRPARSAVTVTHALVLAGYLDMNRTADAFALVSRHDTSCCSRLARDAPLIPKSTGGWP